MRRTIPLITVLIATLAAALALPAASARADIVDTIVRDCQRSQTGYLTGTYTRAQLLKARKNLPSDVLEYTGCYDQIGQALRAVGAGGDPTGGDDTGGSDGTDGGGGSGTTDPTGSLGGGAGGSGGSTGVDSGGGAPTAPPAVPHVGTNDAVELAGASVRPGAIPAVGRDAHELPTPLIVLLVLLGVGALAPAATTLTQRVIARRRL